jgi:diaminohydroxyphosphoribosylaminopyrimidine deaminase / 5-amino-6-(5-phosphoribosylamino)uracil reductase
MELSEKYMFRCLELARLGAGEVAPNPMVGSVIVHNQKIIGEGFHRKYGQPHAEVNAINDVADLDLLKDSTLYVSLEPCAHHGLTPPCSDLIIEKQIPRVVIGIEDPFSEVAGKGIEKLLKAGIEVKRGVLESECRELNKRFFTFHEKKRPYIILKWAQTLDGFIDVDRTREDYGEPTWITGDLALRLVHKIRSKEAAILVGTKTAEKDNPSLTVRHWAGNNPLRIVIDKNNKLSGNLNLFDDSSKTLIFSSNELVQNEWNEWVKIDFQKEVIPRILSELSSRKILSVIVEGGKFLLEKFIESDLWDEMHVFTGNKFFTEGVRAPSVKGKLYAEELLDGDRITVFRNRN